MADVDVTMDGEAILAAIQADGCYQANLDWGTPRPGHAEGTVRRHIEELERNLARLRHRLTEDEQAWLRIVVHTHDTFKADAKRGAPIDDPRSHASLARQFVAGFCDDPDLLATVQFHDEPYALWQQWRHKSHVNEDRLVRLLQTVSNWDLFLAFQIIDGCTDSKDRAPLTWFLVAVEGRVESRFGVDDLW